jgi:hypothetical protein
MAMISSIEPGSGYRIPRPDLPATHSSLYLVGGLHQAEDEWDEWMSTGGLRHTSGIILTGNEQKKMADS